MSASFGFVALPFFDGAAFLLFGGGLSALFERFLGSGSSSSTTDISLSEPSASFDGWTSSSSAEPGSSPGVSAGDSGFGFEEDTLDCFFAGFFTSSSSSSCSSLSEAPSSPPDSGVSVFWRFLDLGFSPGPDRFVLVGVGLGEGLGDSLGFSVCGSPCSLVSCT